MNWKILEDELGSHDEFSNWYYICFSNSREASYHNLKNHAIDVTCFS